MIVLEKRNNFFNLFYLM